MLGSPALLGERGPSAFPGVGACGSRAAQEQSSVPTEAEGRVGREEGAWALHRPWRLSVSWQQAAPGFRQVAFQHFQLLTENGC